MIEKSPPEIINIADPIINITCIFAVLRTASAG